MSVQTNPYRGPGKRAWLRLGFQTAAGARIDLELLADTGCPQGLILSPTVFDAVARSRFGGIQNNLGVMAGAWAQLYMPEIGLVELVRAYSSERVGQMVAREVPTFAGLVGLPILRLGEYGGNASEFWFRYPPP